jgi:hypothetical protein
MLVLAKITIFRQGQERGAWLPNFTSIPAVIRRRAGARFTTPGILEHGSFGGHACKVTIFAREALVKFGKVYSERLIKTSILCSQQAQRLKNQRILIGSSGSGLLVCYLATVLPVITRHPWITSTMSTHKYFLGFVDTGRQIRCSPLVGVQFFHQ